MPDEENPQREKRTDLRVVKTRTAIREAFERLLETTEYTDITVSAIAREAKIGRKTFYVHYSSVDNLLRQMSEEHIENMVKEIKTEGHPDSAEEWVGQFTRSIILALHASPYLNSNVLRCISLRNALDLVREPFAQACARELALHGIEQGPEFEYGLAILVSGACATFETWATSDDGMTVEEAADLASKVAMHGVSGFLSSHEK